MTDALISILKQCIEFSEKHPDCYSVTAIRQLISKDTSKDVLAIINIDFHSGQTIRLDLVRGEFHYRSYSSKFTEATLQDHLNMVESIDQNEAEQKKKVVTHIDQAWDRLEKALIKGEPLPKVSSPTFIGNLTLE